MKGFRIGAGTTPYGTTVSPVPGDRPCATRTFGPRELIFSQHDQVNRIYVLLRGLVMLQYVFYDGRRQIVDIVGPGELCSCENGDFHSTTAETLSFCTVQIFRRAEIESSTDVQKEIARHMSATIARLQEHAALLGRKTSHERVASLLLRLVRICGRSRGAKPQDRQQVVELPLTRREIADYLGVTQETVSRAFTEFKRRGIITYSAPTIVLVEDVQMLAALASSP